jgi:SAM-dependent methyltransferase
MQKLKNLFINSCSGYGLDVFTLRRGLRGTLHLFQDYWKFKAQSGFSEDFAFGFTYPCPADRLEEGGVASGHYFHQDLLVAGRIFERKPARHIDVGSRVDGFVAHVASFRKIEVLDLRPITKSVRNIIFHKFDLMDSAGQFEACCDSLSCLHTLEHIGLGRYGDRLMIDGHMKGFERLWSILKPGGILYLSVPIGPQRIDFNAHRVFAVQTILNMARDKYDLLNFSFVDDLGDLHENVDVSTEAVEKSFDCRYGCGIFEFRKK